MGWNTILTTRIRLVNSEIPNPPAVVTKEDEFAESAGESLEASTTPDEFGAHAKEQTDLNTPLTVDTDDSKGPAQTQQDFKIIRRKLQSYVGFSNLPKQWHRKSIRRGFNLNLMVVGENGLGKSTLINTLFNRSLYPEVETEAAQSQSAEALITTDVNIETVSADIEENGVKLHLTIIDAPGFGSAVNNVNAWKPIVDEIESRFNTYLEAENKVNRQTIIDNRVHALIYFIEPTGHSLKPLDIKLMKEVHEKVNLVPVIAKSDTLTEEEIYEFKQRITDDINNQGIKIFTPPQYEVDDDETILNTQDIMSNVPFAIVGSTVEVTTPDGRKVRGRSYPWGTIEVENENHCDFIKLRQLLIRNFMGELQETTSKNLYENYRTEKLKSLGIQQDNSVFREFDPSTRQEEERVLHEAKLTKMEADLKSIFQSKVTAKEKKLQSQESELFSKHKEMKDKLSANIKALEDKKRSLELAQRTRQESSSSQTHQKTRKGFMRGI